MYIHNLKQQPDLALASKLLHLQETKIAKDNHRNISNYKNIVNEWQPSKNTEKRILYAKNLLSKNDEFSIWLIEIKN